MPRRTKKQHRQMLLSVYEAQDDLETIAGGFGLSLVDLAHWATEEPTQLALRGLQLLSDMQTQLILSRYRMSAATKLLSLAGQEESGEVARKACVDLLKLNLVDEQVPSKNSKKMKKLMSQSKTTNTAEKTAGAKETNSAVCDPAQAKQIVSALEQLGMKR